MLDTTVNPIRDASRRLVRELGFMKPTLAGTDLPPSAVHALIEIGAEGALTAAELCDRLDLDKSSVSRMARKLLDAGELAEGVCAEDGRAKPLRLTRRGEETLAGIDAFARKQVLCALERLAPKAQADLRDGLAAYADALAACRTGLASPARPVTVISGYRPGVIGRAVEMHARFYARAVGFGAFFEAKVASGLAEFSGRLDNPANELWAAVEADEIVGTVAIDGEDLGPGVASQVVHRRGRTARRRRRTAAADGGARLLRPARLFRNAPVDVPGPGRRPQALRGPRLRARGGAPRPAMGRGRRRAEVRPGASRRRGSGRFGVNRHARGRGLCEKLRGFRPLPLAGRVRVGVAQDGMRGRP